MLWERALGTNRYLSACFAAASFLTIVPGFYFTPHYWISLLPAVALLIGALSGAADRYGAQSGRRLAPVAGGWGLAGLGLWIGVAKRADLCCGTGSDAAEGRRTSD